MMKPIVKQLCGVALGALVALPAAATPTFYTNEAAFHAASAALTLESFEAPVDVTQNSATFADILAVSSGHLYLDNQYPSDGVQSLLVNTDSLTFARYHMPYKFTAFGIDLFHFVYQSAEIRFDTDNGSALFNIDTPYDPNDVLRYNRFFLGVVDPQGFFEATLTTTVSGDVVSYDRLQSSTLPPPSGAVPEPAAWALMIAGFAMVGTVLRRQRRLATG